MENKKIKVNVSKDNEKFLFDLSVLMTGLSRHLKRMPDMKFIGLQKFTAVGLIFGLSTEVTSMTPLLIEWGFMKEAK